MIMKKENLKKQKLKIFKTYIKMFWILFFTGIIFVFLIFWAASMEFFGDLPGFEDLENPEKNFATEIITMDGKTLGKFYNENRTPVNYEDLPKNLIQAVVATEDERFYSHSGMDFKSTLRAFVNFGKSGGASTITQQLSKLLFTKRKGTKNKWERILQKIKEWVIAFRLEKQYTKKEILTMYFNKFDFIYNAAGIRSASRIYFGKEPKDLKIEESAVLVGMLKNPWAYSPKRKKTFKKALKRRNQVFSQMHRNDFITNKEKDSLQKRPLKINFTPETHKKGYATYIREYLRNFMKGWIRKNPKPDGTKYNLYADGLKVYVTIDSRMQKYAEKAVASHMSNLQRIFFKEQKHNPTAPFYELEPEQIDEIIYRAIKNTSRGKILKKQGKNKEEILEAFKIKRKMKVFDWRKYKDTLMSPYDSIFYHKHFLHSGLLSLEPQTGYVKAWVGGINYEYFQYDHVRQGKRQVGSTFKPFVYISAMDQLKLSPCDKFPNVLYTIPKEVYGTKTDWTPKNAGEKYGGYYSIKKALAQSINVISARLIHMVGPGTVVRLSQKAGISSRIPPYPSIALGTVDVSLYDMVTAYAVFANQGMRINPMIITKITDKNGSVLKRFTSKTQQVLSESSAYGAIQLMKGVTSYGSGVRLRTNGAMYPDGIITGYPYNFTNPIAGKTGTTQNHSDGWFMGMVPNLVTGVWTGAEDRSVHFKSITKGQGASMALPIWALYMKSCYADPMLRISKGNFEKPENLEIDFNCSESEDSESVNF